MNCSYIHSMHGCSVQLAWSFCTEVFFTRIYRREQRQGLASERSDNDPSSEPRSNIQNRIFNFRNIFAPKRNDNNESGSPVGSLPMPMQPIRRSQSVSQLRKHTDSTSPSRLQSQLDRALAAFQPYPPGMSGSPPPPDYVNDPMVGSPLETTRTKPSAPITTGEVVRDGIEIPPLPIRVGQATGPVGPATRVNRTPNRFAFTPIPTPRSETPPTVPARAPVINTRSLSDDPPSLPSR